MLGHAVSCCAMLQEGVLDPSFVITLRPPLDQAPEAYRMFNDKQTVKVPTRQPV